MNTYRRNLIKALGLAAFAPLGASLAQEPGAGGRPPAFTEIKPPMAVESDGKIEVAEFFWYGCIHCYNLEPALEAWIKKIPPDVQFRRIPAVFNARWGHDAAIYYAFESMGILDKVHRPFFDAIHRDHLQTDNAAALGEWLTKQGVDAKKFNETLKSFGVQSKTKRAAQLTVAYKIDGTPAMAVNGRYTVNAGDALFKTVDALIDQTRKQK
jgi:thiol:disulfide interchange protein DsbA